VGVKKERDRENMYYYRSSEIRGGFRLVINSAGASLNDTPRTATIGPQFSGDFLVVTLLINNRPS